MTTKTKTFDCVEMKCKAQARLRAEYERRSDEFDSIVDFINAKAEQSEVAKMVRAKIAKAKGI